MIGIRLGDLRFAIAHVSDVKSGGTQTFNNSCGAQCGGRTLVTGRESGGACWSADDGDLPWLPNNLNGQRKLLREMQCRSKSASLKYGRAY
jgi:hypothetical protein